MDLQIFRWDRPGVGMICQQVELSVQPFHSFLLSSNPPPCLWSVHFLNPFKFPQSCCRKLSLCSHYHAGLEYCHYHIDSACVRSLWWIGWQWCNIDVGEPLCQCHPFSSLPLPSFQTPDTCGSFSVEHATTTPCMLTLSSLVIVGASLTDHSWLD